MNINNMHSSSCFVGVEVGTGSVRAAVFSRTGTKLGSAVFPIKIYRPKENYVEQSSENIWKQTCKAIKQAIMKANIPVNAIKGIGFDATCSLIALGHSFTPVSISPTGRNCQNIIVRMDHRAIEESSEINKLDDEVLKYIGGKISPEMEIPKILWLKRNLPGQYKKIHKFLDLADYMVYRSTGKDIRSICTMTCKWTYLSHKKGWSNSFFHDLELEDLFMDNKVGSRIEDLGKPVGYLTKEAANDFGVKKNTIVTVGIIDAHAGGLGTIGTEPEHTMSIIAGTSSCHMINSSFSIFAKGIWGPYYNVMLPDMWLNEWGQSASGALLDHIISDSGYFYKLDREANQRKINHYQILNEAILEMENDIPLITNHFHLLGYFHGNRSPRADPHLKGMISGLTLFQTKKELAKKYLAGIQSVAYGTKHIIETLNKAGHKIKRIHLCGGNTKNWLWVREHSDITGCTISLPSELDSVFLGGAMLAATASGYFSDIYAAIQEMWAEGKKIKPRSEYKDYHDKKYKVFHEMYHDQIKYKDMMK